VSALKEYPRFNASLDASGENLIFKKYFHIGIAVDTPDGLVVPVVRDVDRKTLVELASELGEISAKARDKKTKALGDARWVFYHFQPWWYWRHQVHAYR
jgi:pyruvate dehydrogenase E2 component (dihydrolipoamide acetyltransferase)